MEVMEKMDQWLAAFREGWLAHLQQTGQTDFKRYVRPTNKSVPAGRGLDLSQSRLVFISSAGAYLAATQTPFDAPNLLGDYSLRLFPLSTPFEALAYAHDHYDHRAVETDPQVLLPLRHLEDLAAGGVIGELAPTVISFMGYQPDAIRTVNELIPAVIEAVQAERADAALLVPS